MSDKHTAPDQKLNGSAVRWWPGIMVVVGLAAAVDRVLQGRPLQAAGVLLLFLAIPVGSYAASLGLVVWRLIGPAVLILLGVGYLFRQREVR